MVDLTFVERLVDVVAGGDEEGGGEDEREDCESCGVEDAKKGNARAFDMHGGGLRGIVVVRMFGIQKRWIVEKALIEVEPGSRGGSIPLFTLWRYQRWILWLPIS